MTDCIHHWRIEEPHGPVSDGRCRKCGARRQFANYDRKTEAYNTERPMPGFALGRGYWGFRWE